MIMGWEWGQDPGSWGFFKTSMAFNSGCINHLVTIQRGDHQNGELRRGRD